MEKEKKKVKIHTAYRTALTYPCAYNLPNSQAARYLRSVSGYLAVAASAPQSCLQYYQLRRGGRGQRPPPPSCGRHRPCAAVLGHDTTTTLTMHALTVSPSDTQVRLAELTEVPSSPDCSEPVHTCTDARNLIGLSCVL